MVELRLHRATPAPRLRYLWAKTVTGFDPTKCCMACLLGKKCRAVRVGMADDEWVALDDGRSPFVYVCGSVGVYRTNLHLALRPRLGAELSFVSDLGMKVEVRGAERVQIEPLPQEFACSPKQAACRNYRFGFQAFAESLRAAS